MITSIVIGILTSYIAELVAALNKRFQGTPLEGDAAFLVVLAISLVGAAVKIFYVDHTPIPNALAGWEALYPSFAEVWATSQIYFLYVMKKLNLDVSTTPNDLVPSPVSVTAKTDSANTNSGI